MRTLLFTTLAEYQTRFWLPVAKELERLGQSVAMVSFDDRSTEMLRAAGVNTSAYSQQAEPFGERDVESVLSRIGDDGANFWLSHERVVFGRSDVQAMRRKLARSFILSQQAINDCGGGAILVQELGGFLSNVGSFFAARANSVDNFFIEPSFFRGRFLLTSNSFGAPQFRQDRVAVESEFAAYIDQTLSSNSIVIPKKDSHHYSPALAKILNVPNARRLLVKLFDKYFLGKQQEFGHIGRHVRQHANMLANSYKLRGVYTSLESVDRFLYYPFHVPGDVALTLRAPEYLDQIALVDYLCRVAPDGMQVVVKEHPAMIGAIDADGLIKLKRKYDNLSVLSPATNNYRVLRAAEGVITVNSKSGAEAGLLGKPVIVLGDAFYRDAPFSIAVGELAGLREAIGRGLGCVPDGSAVHDWFATVWEQTYQGELYYLDPQNIRLFARSLVAGLNDH